MSAALPSPRLQQARDSERLSPRYDENNDGEMAAKSQLAAVQGAKYPAVTGTITPERFLKSLSHSNTILSEADLSGSFRFENRQPNRVGQFSDRPQKHVQNNHLGGPVPSPQSTNVRALSDSTNEQQSTKPKQKEPFDLPELIFYDPKESNRNINGSVPNSTSTIVPNIVSDVREVAPIEPPTMKAKDKYTTSPSLPGQIAAPLDKEIDIRKPVLLSSPHQGKPIQFEDSTSISSHPSIAQKDKSLLRDNTELNTHKAPVKSQALEASPHLDHSQKYHHRQQSFGSRCGDLEEPRYQRPRCHKNAPSASSRDGSRRYRSSRKYAESAGEKQERSHSRTSNISRKRSAVSKPPPRRESGRKHEAMQQLAQYWNECLKIAEEEKAEANEEIERLQIEMRGQSRKLEEARLRLGQKEVQVNELESQNAELKEHDDGTTSQNAKLTEEVDELRKELSDSNTKISHLGEKCKSFKDKINEVLTEQQTLYGQVEASFQAAVTELEQEKARRETDVKEIDSALDLCEKKRERMKREFDDIHARDQNEIRQSKQTISLLTNEIKAQHEEAMTREKDLAENLRRQSDIQYQNGQEKLQHVESKVDLVLDACRQRFQKENENSAPIASISDKIDLVVDVIGSTPSQNQQKLFEITRSAIEPIAQELENRIVSQISSRMDGEFSKYDELEKTISKFAQAFQYELANITRAISWQLEAKRIEQTSNTDHLHNTIVESLKDMRDEMVYTKELCEGTRNVQHELNKIVRDALASTTESERNSLTRKIEERDSTINDLWHQLSSLKDDHSAKMEAFSAKEAAQEQTIITQLFRDNLHHIGQSFQQEFERERQDFSEKMSHNEKSNENLRAQIQEAISKIIELKVSGSPDAEKLDEQLQGERHSVASLTRKIGNLEQELKNTEMIRGQWHQGLTSVNTFRAKLEAVAQRLPKVEAIAAKLNGITRLNEVIDSTSKFFDAEKQWLKTELSGRSKVGEPNPDDQLGSNMIVTSASQDPILKLNSLAFPSELLPTNRKVESLIEENLHAEDASRRKVLVYSPTGDSESPSPPPSIGQEQKRRREAVRPRSILRSSKELLQKMQASQMSEFRGNPMHGSQFNRPVVAETAPGCGNDMANKIINDLQSTLAPPPRFQHGWELPTVAEFEESVRLGSRKRECEFEVFDNFEDHNKKIKGNNTVISSESDHTRNVTVSPQI